MSDPLGDPPAAPRGVASTSVWSATCKDCRKERQDATDPPTFEYSSEWSARVLERGGTRTDRCPRHRRAHREAIRAVAVAYVDLAAIGRVADESDPSGPLGGLGPLPTTHEQRTLDVDLSGFQFGLTDADIHELLSGLADAPGGVTRRVAVLEAGTGTGKSTFGPFRLLSPPAGAPLRLTDVGPIVVTEPRIPAVTNCAAFVGEQLCYGHDPVCGRHTGPGFPVGFQTSGNKNWDDACRLLYVTDGTMINWIKDGRLAQIGAVIVDEAHERSENIDLILALLRDQLPRYPHLRVIIASATIDKNFFVEYFGGQQSVYYQHVPPTKSVGYGIPLFPGLELTAADLAEGIADGIGGRFAGFSSEILLEDTRQTLREHASELLALRPSAAVASDEWLDRMPGAVAEQALRILQGTPSGDILCFLPKTTMIDHAVRAIQHGVHGRRDVEVYPLLAATPDAVKDKALAPSKQGTRKVVVSSNLAETSLTVSGVRYVVDSGLICQSEWDPELARGGVPTKPHSQSGVRQRWGRVGRDAPGFVFPLYSHDQFLALPRDTPAGSTRTNLEQFLVKLKGAGVDALDDVALPANFAHENYTPDAHGQRAAALFSAELARASASLVASGAVDAEGHLTNLGRELERASGPAEHAIAVMLADRLACVHEVAVALVLLPNSLCGPRGLLQYDVAWPAAWRLHACRSHRSLAVGCEDDLDLVLRVFSEWFAAPDRETWARTRWVNHTLLSDALDSMRAVVDGLSPGMKKQAMRSVDVRLAPRARAVLARAMTLQTFVPSSDGQGWKDPRKTHAPAATTGYYQLTAPSGPVAAFGRFQPPAPEGASDPAQVLLSGLVMVPEWAVDGQPDGFELLERTAAHARVTDIAPEQSTLAWIRDQLPVGAVVRVGVDGDLTPLTGGAPYPGDLPDLDSEDDDAPLVTSRRSSRRTNADREANGSWGATRVPAGEVPEEEAAQALVGVEEPKPEALDGSVAFEVEDTSSSLPSATPERVSVRWTDDAGGSTQGRVRGCILDGKQVALECEAVDVAIPQPLDGPTEPFGTELVLTVRGWDSDFRDNFRVLEADDGRRFYLHPRTRGLGGRDVGLAAALATDTRLTWTVVPGVRSKDRADLSPLPALRRSVAAAQAASKGGWLPASLETTRDAAGSSTSLVRLLLPDLDSELATITVAPKFLRDIDSPGNPSQDVEVRLGPADAAELLWPSARDFDPKTGDQLLREHGYSLRAAGSRGVKPVTGLLDMDTVTALLDLRPYSADWGRRVWRFWLEAQQLRILSLRLAGAEDSVQLPGWLNDAWPSAARRKLAEQKGLAKIVWDASGLVHLLGKPDAVSAAREAITAIAAGARLQVPTASIGIVLGKEKAKLQALQQTPGVAWCDMRGPILTVLGTREAVDGIVATVGSDMKRATGTLTLSNDSNIPRFIGTGGARVKTLCAKTGCSVRQHGKTTTFTVIATSRASLDDFFDAVRSGIDDRATMDPDAQGTVTDLTTDRPFLSDQRRSGL